MQDFTQLKVWQKAHSFTVNLYKMTADFPSEEKFPKGYRFAYGRNGDFGQSTFAGNPQITPSEFSRFVDLAQGSAYEVRCQLFIARDLGYLPVDKFELLIDKIDEISRMMIAFQKKLKANS